jgi:PadR family transcriptional regulator, regulatory protein PadR
MYGYELAAELDRRSNGVFALGQGTLYPLLYSLEAKGQIRVSREEASPQQGRTRRYYAVTAKGRAELEANVVTWREIARGMRLVLEGSHA